MVHRVLMNYMEGRRGWYVSFLEADCQTALPRKLTFASADKIRSMHARFGASQMSEDKNAIEHGISIGRGGVWLSLNEEQYQKLRLIAGNSAGASATGQRACGADRDSN